MSNDDQQSIDDLAAAYALDALDAADRIRFEAQASPEARAEAEALRETASRLASDEATPSPFLRASVLDAIQRTPQLPAEDARVTELRPSGAPLEHEQHERAVGGDAPAEVEVPAVASVGPAERRARARWSPIRTVVAVAAAAVVIAGGVAVGTSLGRDDEAAAVQAIEAAPDAERAEVAMADGTVATVVWAASEGRSAVLFEGLDDAPEGSVYQAWYIDAAGPHSAGTFSAEGASTAFVLEGELGQGAVVGITVEPEGGSEQPTTEPILAVET